MAPGGPPATLTGLAGKVAVVLGGAGAIGSATAELLAASGAAVVVADIAVDAGERSVERLVASGGQAAFIRADATDEAGVAGAVAAAVERFGRLDAAVTSVLHDRRAPAAQLALGDWEAVVAAGLTSAFLLSRAALPHLLAAGGGSLTFVSSIQARVGFPGEAAYASAKAGLTGLARQLAVEYGPHGVRVNTVQPSLVLTPDTLEDYAGRAEALRRVEACFPLRRAGRPRDIAAAVAFLVSDAAGFVSGIDLPVDGGIGVASAGSALRLLDDDTLAEPGGAQPA